MLKKPTSFGILLFAAILSVSLANALNIEDNLYPNTWGSYGESGTNLYTVTPFISQHSGTLLNLKLFLGCDVINGYNTTLNYYLEFYDNKKSSGGTKVAQTNTIIKNCTGYVDNSASKEWLNFTVTIFSNLNKSQQYYTYFMSPDNGIFVSANFTSGLDNWLWNSLTSIDEVTPNSMALNYKMVINTSDQDNDLVADEDDSCPLVQGLINNFGCPDTESPIINLILPSNNSYQSSFNPIYNVSDISIYSCYSVNNSIVEGTNYWSINCTDEYNNSAVSEQRMFKKDSIAPVITLISPENNSYQSSFTPNYSVTETNNYSCTSVNNSIVEGLNHWQINCTDEAGNSGLSPEWMFKIDTTKPNTTRIGNNLSCTDNILCQKTFWSLGVWNEGTEFNLSEGINNLSYYSIDENNNTEDTNNEIITIDTIKPNLTIYSPNESTYDTNTTINLSALDTNLNAFYWLLNSTSHTESYLIVTLPTGNYSLYAYTNDTFGNFEEKIVNFTISDLTPPELSLSYSGGILYAGTNENTTCYYNTSDTNLTLMNENASMTNQVALNLPYGSYNYYVECYDLSGNKNNSTIAITLNPPSDPQPQSNSGGGGSGSSDSAPIGYFGTPASNKENIVISTINPGEKKDIKINNKDISIKQISIEVNNQARNIDITITKESGKPAEVTKASSENEREYEYLTINHPNLKNEDIKKGVISFEVDAKWIADNKIEKVVLKRYSEGKWETLNTRKATINIDRILYEAETPGFSTFAIVGEKKVPIALNEGKGVGGEKVNDVIDEVPKNEDNAKIPPIEESWFKRNIVVIIPLVIVMIVAVSVFFLREKPKKPIVEQV